MCTRLLALPDHHGVTWALPSPTPNFVFGDAVSVSNYLFDIPPPSVRPLVGPRTRVRFRIEKLGKMLGAVREPVSDDMDNQYSPKVGIMIPLSCAKQFKIIAGNTAKLDLMCSKVSGNVKDLLNIFLTLEPPNCSTQIKKYKLNVRKCYPCTSPNL